MIAPYLEIRVARRLNSPNKNRGAHWSKRHRERNEWQFELLAAAPAGWRTWSLVLETMTRRDANGHWRIHETRKRERRAVTVWRIVPSRRNFCKDPDNRAFTVKPIYDALKTIGLVFDDSDAWCTRTLVEEVGGDHTIVRIQKGPDACDD